MQPQDAELRDRLYQYIGQMKVELDWLKKGMSCSAWSDAAYGSNPTIPNCPCGGNARCWPGGGQLLLPSGPGVGGEPFLPAIAGRGIYATPFLRRAQNDRFWLRLQQHYAVGSRSGCGGCCGPCGLDGRLSRKPRLSLNPLEHKRFPYLLKGLAIVRPNQVWSIDITYIRLRGGFVYLGGGPLFDWFSRYVLAWELSISLEADFCVVVVERAMRPPSDRRSSTAIWRVHFTSAPFQAPLLAAQVRLSMDGRGTGLRQHLHVERLWRTVSSTRKSHLKGTTGTCRKLATASACISRFYNDQRIHQSLLAYRTP